MKIAITVLLTVCIAVIGYQSSLYKAEVRFLQKASNIQYAEIVALKARSCRIATCADSRMGWSPAQATRAKEICGEPDACPRRQLFIAGDEVEPITALTETWEMGILTCK